MPKYSFGKRLDSQSARNKGTPGPGAYEMKSQLSKIAYTMRPRTGVKVILSGSQPVGPGAYEVTDVIKRPKVRCVFSKSKRFGMKVKNANVGPGSYNLPDTKSKIAYSMRPRTGLKSNNANFPGPGQYFPKLNLVTNKAARTIFGKEKRGKENLNVKKMKKIGPGSYNPFYRRNAPAYSFGKDKKSEDLRKKNTGPGPGQYDFKSFLESYPAYATWKVN